MTQTTLRPWKTLALYRKNSTFLALVKSGRVLSSSIPVVIVVCIGGDGVVALFDD